jgi:predicted esterase
VAVLGVAAAAAQQNAAPVAGDAAFAAFFDAPDPQATAAASDQILASGVGFDEAFGRLRRGRTYRSDVPRGVVQASYRSDSGEYFYALDVPATYDPNRKYQVRFQLHGGVDRIEDNGPREAGARGRLAGAEQIYVMPYAWRDAPWWSRRQTVNLQTILDLVKRAYNVDENRVVLAGVSDGGTGAYYTAMRATTPFASFVPLNGFILVLKNETLEADGDLFPHNLVNKPMFVVNGGRDPQYPTSMVDPYVEHLRKAGVDLVYRPQPDAAHDTSWWPDLRDTVEQFVAQHPRQALPDRLTWETGDVPGRAHWLVIDRLAARRPEDPPLPDLNVRATRPAPDFGIRSSGARINRVIKGSNAQQIGLKSGDIVASISNQPIGAGTDVAEVLRGFPAGRPLLLTVRRGSEPVRLTGRYAPTVLPGEADAMFPRQGESGRVDLVRTGNRVEVTSRGVGAFTLLLSPDQFDFDAEVTVVVNGRTAFAGRVRKDLRSLLKWAAADNDRTMLFGAELPVSVPQ